MSHVKLARKGNTRGLRDKGSLSVRYHSTEIVNVRDGSITLRSGGWESVTTKQRMNQAAREFDLGFAVFQADYRWYVMIDGSKHHFRDGMSFRAPADWK